MAAARYNPHAARTFEVRLVECEHDARRHNQAEHDRVEEPVGHRVDADLAELALRPKEAQRVALRHGRALGENCVVLPRGRGLFDVAAIFEPDEVEAVAPGAAEAEKRVVVVKEEMVVIPHLDVPVALARFPGFVGDRFGRVPIVHLLRRYPLQVRQLLDAS